MLKTLKLGLVPYEKALQAMRSFTELRDEATLDELWCLEHPPVFTLGAAGRKEHILAPGEIPVVSSCRGGQVTYHGPGQLIFYPLLQLKRYALNVKQLVYCLEQCVLNLLTLLKIAGGHRIEGAPGIYIHEQKIASLGLRVRKGYSYHGLSLNVCMDLEPFQRINPCGIPDLRICQLSDFQPNIDIATVQSLFIQLLLEALNTGTSHG